jgi:hypothetical protein
VIGPCSQPLHPGRPSGLSRLVDDHPDGSDLAFDAAVPDPTSGAVMSWLDVTSLSHPGSPRAVLELGGAPDLASPAWLPAG